DDCRQDLLTIQTGASEVVVDTCPDLRQGRRERDEALVLGGFAPIAIARVIAVLLATASVAPGGLEVPVRGGADPDVRPRGRDGEGADPGKNLAIADGPSLGVAIYEPPTGSTAGDARSPIAGMAEPHGVGCHIGHERRMAVPTCRPTRVREERTRSDLAAGRWDMSRHVVVAPNGRPDDSLG